MDAQPFKAALLIIKAASEMAQYRFFIGYPFVTVQLGLFFVTKSTKFFHSFMLFVTLAFFVVRIRDIL